MTARVHETDPLCTHHQELVENQTEIREGQSELRAHLVWVKRIGWSVLVLMLTYLASFWSGLYYLTGIAHSLALQEQSNRDALVRQEKDIGELKQVDKEICKKIEHLNWKVSLKGGAKNEPSNSRIFADPE